MKHTLSHQAAFHQHSIGAPPIEPSIEKNVFPSAHDALTLPARCMCVWAYGSSSVDAASSIRPNAEHVRTSQQPPDEPSPPADIASLTPPSSQEPSGTY
jgi:hypothetical protein